MTKLYDEDIEEIADTIGMMVQHPSIDRLDVKLNEPGVSAIVYWAGPVLRVDIKGVLRRGT